MTLAQQQSILLNTYPFLKKEDLDLFFGIGTYQLVKNKTVLIQAGQISHKTIFIFQGMLRGYFINEKGEEKNIFLRPEHTITGAPECLFHNQATKYTFEVISDSHLFIMNYKKFQEQAFTRPNLMQIYIHGLQENILTLVSRVESLIDRLPEKRYEELLARSPQFFQKAYHKHIANYLGITPVSLSRIIKRKLDARN